MEERKLREREFHNLIRDGGGELDAARSNQKFYSIVRSSKGYMDRWLYPRCHGKRVLDYGCGNGGFTCWLARNGAEVVGIDISDVSVRNARAAAAREGLDGRANCLVMDCEILAFGDCSFDLIVVSGVLHHLDLERALGEMSRVLKNDGEVICGEGLADNPLIRLYRRMTPHLRTAWEADHILRTRDLKRVKKYFGRMHSRYFHMFTIAAVPFRNTRFFGAILSALEFVMRWSCDFPLSGAMHGRSF
ncbi:MAG: class I SAM-dependent methyltransferase [Acidobacteria bacterium]|nr:MAG: class I SAM-dependent methyltransferase [Acidobacteriota bacterium]